MKPPPLRYAQVREDPDIDIEALNITGADRVLTVTSGGCTALTLLAEGPASLTTIDLNPTQNFLLELKVAALTQLPLDQTRRFLGARKGFDRMALYLHVRESLSTEARAYWDHRPRDVRRGVLHAGTTEQMMRWMPFLVFLLVHSRKRARELLRLRTTEEVHRYFEDTWNTPRWRGALRLAFHPALFRQRLGNGFFERLGSTSPDNLWAARMKRLFTQTPPRKNYFFTQLLFGRYPPGEKGLPPYLRKGPAARVIRHIPRLTRKTEDLGSHLDRVPPGTYTKMTLSNALEWVPDHELHSLFEKVAQSLAPGGRIVHRHLLAVTPIPAGIPLKENRAESDRFTVHDRSALYERVSVYDRV
jgi:S-adenosylmethionine-diacylglycerol 3-amino-3-carboxypropyl transferase